MWTIQWFVAYVQNCDTVITINFRPLSSPPQNTQPLTSHCPLPWATTNLLSVPIDLPILDILHKWNHVICGLCEWLLSGYVLKSSWDYQPKGAAVGPTADLPRSGRDKITQPSACARHYSEHFTCIHAFNPHSHILRQALTFPSVQTLWPNDHSGSEPQFLCFLKEKSKLTKLLVSLILIHLLPSGETQKAERDASKYIIRGHISGSKFHQPLPPKD